MRPSSAPLASRGVRVMDVEKPIFVSPPQFTSPESLRVRPLLLKPQWMNGLSERLLVSHYENNYGGAVRRLNAIEDELARLDPAAAPGFLLNGLKREEIVAANSMILHEVYFDALGGDGAGPAGELAAAVEAGF